MSQCRSLGREEANGGETITCPVVDESRSYCFSTINSWSRVASCETCVDRREEEEGSELAVTHAISIYESGYASVARGEWKRRKRNALTTGDSLSLSRFILAEWTRGTSW